MQGGKAGAKARHAAMQPQSTPEATRKVALRPEPQQPAPAPLSKAEKRRLAREHQHAASEQQERRVKRNMLIRCRHFAQAIAIGAELLGLIDCIACSR